MSSLPKEAYLQLKDKARANYTKGQFSEDLKKHINHAIISKEIEEIDISRIVFPEGFYFRMGEFLPECEIKNRKICEKALIAHNTVFSGNVSLGNIDFIQAVEFDGAVFHRRVLSQGARFHSQINFPGSEFFRQCNFSKTEYLLSCTVNFYHSRFHESVSFADSKFHEDSDLIFDYSRFKDVAFFNNTEFQGKVGFSDAIFESSCNFSFAKFFQDASFIGTYFTRLTRFTGIQLSQTLDFKRSFFFENCLFNHLHLKNHGRISFDDINVRESTRIVLGAIDSVEGECKKERITFQRFSMILDSPAVVIKDCKSGKGEKPLIKFENCFFERGTIRFENCDLRFIDNFVQADQKVFDALTFLNCELPVHTPPHLFLPFFLELRTLDNFEERRGFGNTLTKGLLTHKRLDNVIRLREQLLYKFKEQRIQLASRRKEKYAFLKSQAEKQGESQLGSDFFFSQMYWSKIENPTFTNLFYYSLSGYGLSVFRPLITYLILFVIFFFFYFAIHFDRSDVFLADLHNLPNVFTNIIKYIPTPLGLTILASSPMPVDIYVTKILDIVPTPYSGWHLVITFLIYVPQKVLQLFCLFELAAAVRNKVKR